MPERKMPALIDHRTRFTVRRLMIAVAVTAVLICLLFPLSAADRNRMAAYERLGSTEPKVGLTKAQVIRQIGPPSSRKAPVNPNHATLYTWVAEFESGLEYHEFTLNLSIGNNDEVVGWGLFKSECQGLQALLIHVLRLGARIGLY